VQVVHDKFFGTEINVKNLNRPQWRHPATCDCCRWLRGTALKSNTLREEEWGQANQANNTQSERESQREGNRWPGPSLSMGSDTVLEYRDKRREGKRQRQRQGEKENHRKRQARRERKRERERKGKTGRG
jgi:hypothetical protein